MQTLLLPKSVPEPGYAARRTRPVDFVPIKIARGIYVLTVQMRGFESYTVTLEVDGARAISIPVRVGKNTNYVQVPESAQP